MRLLLDTHSFLWFIGGDERLSTTAREAIGDIDNDVFLSIASLWELAVKVNIGKLRLPRPFHEVIPAQLSRNAIDILPVDVAHLARYVDLPLHHRDPFDRLIIVQAMVENLTVVGRDGAFAQYDLGLLW